MLIRAIASGPHLIVEMFRRLHEAAIRGLGLFAYRETGRLVFLHIAGVAFCLAMMFFFGLFLLEALLHPFSRAMILLPFLSYGCREVCAFIHRGVRMAMVVWLLNMPEEKLTLAERQQTEFCLKRMTEFQDHGYDFDDWDGVPEMMNAARRRLRFS